MSGDFNLLERIDPPPLLGSPRQLLKSEIDGLWSLFVEINSRWRLFHTRDAKIEVPDAKNLHSSWLEFVTLRAQPHQYADYLQQLPCYVEEYVNALSVIAALCSHDDSEYALDPLLAVTTQPENSRIWHARKFVVEKFMTVMIVAGGFKEFGGHNYDGFLGDCTLITRKQFLHFGTTDSVTLRIPEHSPTDSDHMRPPKVSDF